MANVSAMPKIGELERVDSVTVHNGGNAMTAAVNLKRLGVESYLVGKVGDDLFGKGLLAGVKDSGVCTDGIKVDRDNQTSVSIVLLQNGERSFLHTVGANGSFKLDDIDFSVIDKVDLVFLTGVFLMDTFDGEEAIEFLKKCKEMDKTTFLDVCWDARGRWGSILNGYLPYVDYFMPSIDEAKEISRCNGTPDEIADVFTSMGAKNIIIKLGSKGSYIRLHGEREGRIFPSKRVDNVVDTTGAGDSFCSGFLSGFARNLPIDECMSFANAAGALCVAKKGATSWVTSFEDLKKYKEAE
jgi:sugar/nucleoside kinase (ribokinase family)